MFWKKGATGKQKLPGPQAIPEPVRGHLVVDRKMDPDLVAIFKAVVRKRSDGEKAFDVRVFDESEAAVKKVTVKDYTSLDTHPNLILYEGRFDEQSRQVELQEKKRVNWDVPFSTEAEIRQKLEALSEPGGTVFFYLARGPKLGGPLGRGAAVVELNPNYPGKRQKKYILNTADVDGMEPVGKGDKLFDSDKAKDVARWIKEAHHKRLY